MRLEDEQYEEIKNTVIDTFIEYGIKSIPISAFEMAVRMGLTVIPYSALNEEQKRSALKISKDGFSTELENHEWIIYYNDYWQNYGRINHTIMHEVGHYALGHIKEGEQEEAEAEFFAKYALAPPPLIHSFGQNINPDLIRDKFDVSYQAAFYAYKYYKNWLKYGNRDYTNYEIRMLDQFMLA